MRIIERKPDPRAQYNLEQSGIAPLLARLYSLRGVQSASEVNTGLDSLLPPASLTHCEAAGRLLADAIGAGKQMCVIADYDCDGATACAVAIRGLRSMGARVSYVVPNRFDYGYGLSAPIVDLALLQNPKPELLITVDNGIASVAGIAHARQLGLDVLVTDHHLAGAELPNANVIVNPNQPGCKFESKALAGVGVMFYVLLALRAQLRTRGVFTSATQPKLDALLDLVALGTVADVVPLDSNNRKLVAQGLARIRQGRMQAGIAALFEVASRHAAQASSFDMGFALGPRINAAGRLSDMSLGIETLITDDAARAAELAKLLDGINRERRTLEAGIREEALAGLKVTPGADEAAIVLYEPHWHEGVVGIVAGRIKELHYRPCIVFAPGKDGLLKGSGRSIAGFHLRDALDLVSKREPDLIVKFGGHAMAAGLSIAAENVQRFSAAFKQVAKEGLSPAQLARVVETDGSLPAALYRVDTVEHLLAQVWGQGFAAPTFSDQVVVLRHRLLGTAHSAFTLQLGDETREAVRWGSTEALPSHCKIAWRPSVDTFSGRARVRMTIEAVEE